MVDSSSLGSLPGQSGSRSSKDDQGYLLGSSDPGLYLLFIGLIFVKIIRSFDSIHNKHCEISVTLKRITKKIIAKIQLEAGVKKWKR